MRLSVRLNLSLIAGVTLVSLAIAAYQTQGETRGLKRDLERHAIELAESLEKSAAPLVANQARPKLQELVDQFQSRQRLAGVAIYDAQGEALAATSSLSTRLTGEPAPVARDHWEEGGTGQFFSSGDTEMHVFELPIRSGGSVTFICEPMKATAAVRSRGVGTGAGSYLVRRS